jgi:hypothetical protein
VIAAVSSHNHPPALFSASILNSEKIKYRIPTPRSTCAFLQPRVQILYKNIKRASLKIKDPPTQ